MMTNRTGLAILFAAAAAAAAATVAADGATPGNAGADTGVRLVARTDRASYQFGEPVWLYVTIANGGSAEVTVENPHCSRTQTRIDITKPGGPTLPMTGPASCSTTILERIAPGHDMIYAFELLEFYGVDGDGTYPFGILAPGEYVVRYRTHDHATEDVRFTVSDLDPADTIAFHAYLRLLSDVGASTLRDSTERFREFVATYPSSPFAAALLCRAGVVSDLFFDSAQAREDFEQLLYLYPESGYASVAVRHLAFGMGRRAAAGLELLRRVSEELPGTFAADMAARVVTRLEDEVVRPGKSLDRRDG